MLKPQVYQSRSPKTLFLLPKPFIHENGGQTHLSVLSRPSLLKTQRKIRVGYKPGNVQAISEITEKQLKSTKVKAIVTVNRTVGGFLSNLGINRGLDDVTDLLGKTLLLELVSAELDSRTGSEKPTIKGYAHKKDEKGSEIIYEADLEVEGSFGQVGAILVENEHHKEMFVKDIALEGFITGTVNISCNSWVHAKNDNKRKRVFFANKSYLPSETPNGLRRLREAELELLRGNGKGERKKGERIYEYDFYNDLGNPDSDPDLKRPVLGGKENPYPRRCRTGRARCNTDTLSESISSSVYVPRDEEFSEVKEHTFSAKTVYSVLHALVPQLETALVDPDLAFPYFTAIDSLFNEGVNLPPLKEQGWKDILPNLIKTITDEAKEVLAFDTPDTMERDRFFWFRDEEFGRQTLAGLNPMSLQLVTEWPLKSELDPEIYGPPESAITTEMIEQQIRGFMTVEEAIKQKKLFMLDYHDLFLPFVSKVRQLENTTLYGSRTIFFLTPDGTLRPLAIELTRPPMDGKPQWKDAYVPTWHSTGVWLWRLAKAHVLAHESGYHQLISHWLKTHACTEPYIIAANRQLSVMHPIYRLLHPHFRYTMEINALARQALINAGGIIESSFSPGKYCLEMSSVIYDKLWRFDQQAMPQELISRGMAVQDPSAPHGVKLRIEDYPFASDGLLLWDAIKAWVSDYVNHYYPDPSLILSDKELQAFWTEVRTVGHGDKKDEPWWPELKTPKDLIEIVSTIAWVTSGHHAAVNFGQYAYAGYFPNRPTTARLKMPSEDPTDEGWKMFAEKPEVVLLTTFPSQVQATKVMAVLDVLSNHSPDEEYIGEKIEPAWAEDPNIKAAFEKFAGRLKELEGIIDERNANPSLKNRNGAGIVPYELLKPFSEPGVTARGVPYSISI
ncbi:linoleate 13S-lipoxygenase 2-1, chloroplastic [Ricinus communis]|uniref:Lipoxygenase n=1 Tax=Ricinus communis TaxID=3988 RepID=B9RI74_RICCO|nr:linoleate 13S-lipoxygenase 2-1, chloroplastic [Ricinus communis]EEF48846.1 lipoxygenase, putative [Ricinus communis]|eukprot:XP_002513443.1 linoleate 13S-lipoxygenase 2-1, chloroplastic [Ricinus communis]